MMLTFHSTFIKNNHYKKHVCKEEQAKLIMECRRSVLSDYRWCEQNRIHPGNFYNWASKFMKKGCTFPEPASKTKAVPNIQDVVKKVMTLNLQ